MLFPHYSYSLSQIIDDQGELAEHSTQIYGLLPGLTNRPRPQDEHRAVASPEREKWDASEPSSIKAGLGIRVPNQAKTERRLAEVIKFGRGC